MSGPSTSPRSCCDSPCPERRDGSRSEPGTRPLMWRVPVIRRAQKESPGDFALGRWAQEVVPAVRETLARV